MRYFLTKDSGSVIRDKQAFGGDDSQADGLIANYLQDHEGWTAEEVDAEAFETAVSVTDQTDSRTDAVNTLLTDPSPNAKFTRAVMMVMLDELNLIRGLINNAPVRTLAQLKTAVQNKINTGAAD